MSEFEHEGEVRCLYCFELFYPPRSAETCVCPFCRTEWRLRWPYMETPVIKCPVWGKGKKVLSEQEEKESDSP